MKRISSLVLLVAIALSALAQRPLPVSGSWVNLFYQDVRNKYTNPQHLDNSEPELWRAKIDQMHRMGIEYIVFMAVANEGRAAYPSNIMPHSYPDGQVSPVEAIIKQAEKNGQKVFLSIGWAENQDDNLKRPEILNRQLQIMDELAQLYGSNPAVYGWYLPVEDCLGPILPETSVVAVNKLVAKAHEITPGMKTMISPYGFFCSDFDNPEFGRRIQRLKVDIIAYQDEVGCVREAFPLPALREKWHKIKKIHDQCGIELWANCELFAWEKDTNSRSSALIPAAPGRIIAQLQAATDGGVNRIISFMTTGIIDDYADAYRLGQPGVTKYVADEYAKWRVGDEKYSLFEQSLSGSLKNKVVDKSNPLFDGKYAQETPDDRAWTKFKGLKTEIDVPTEGATKLFVRFFDCHKKGYAIPYKIGISVPDGNGNYRLASIADITPFPNNRHDAWVEPCLLTVPSAPKVRLTLLSDGASIAIDEIVVK